MLYPWEVDVPTQHFEVHKKVGFLSSMVMFRVQCSYKNSVVPFHYCTPQRDLSNGLSSDRNGDHMQMLCPQVVDVRTYYFGIQHNVGESYYSVIFRVYHIQRHGLLHFKYCGPRPYLLKSLLRDPNEYYMQQFCPQIVYVPTYQFQVNNTIAI